MRAILRWFRTNFGHKRAILGTKWDRFGTKIGSFCDHCGWFWTIFWSIPCHFEVTWGPFWPRFGIFLRLLWCRFDPIFEAFSGHFWTVFGPFLPILGAIFTVILRFFGGILGSWMQNDARESKNICKFLPKRHQCYAKLCKNKPFYAYKTLVSLKNGQNHVSTNESGQQVGVSVSILNGFWVFICTSMKFYMTFERIFGYFWPFDRFWAIFDPIWAIYGQ